MSLLRVQVPLGRDLLGGVEQASSAPWARGHLPAE